MFYKLNEEEEQSRQKRDHILSCSWNGNDQLEKRCPAWARIFKPFKEPRNLFPAWLAGKTTLLDVQAHQAT
jgi:hypothetical protein